MKSIIKAILLIALVLTASVLALTACDQMAPAPVPSAKHVHTIAIDSAIPPTCTEPGLSMGRHCSECNEVLLVQQRVEPLGHKEVVDEAVPATCTEDGLTEGKHCSVCDVVLEEQTTVPAGHTVVIDEAVAPTCTEKGLTEGSHCSGCNEVFVAQKSVDSLGHIEVFDKSVASTCTESGLTEGSHCSRCNKSIIKQVTVPALGHVEVVDAGYAATCTTAGLTDGKHCSRCNETITHQQVIDPLNHTEVIDAGYAATCTTPGLTDGKHCSVCGETLVAQTILPASHTEIIDTGYDATCTAPGLTDGKHCEKCGDVLVEQEVIPAGHNIVVDEAVEATCDKSGLTEGSSCSKCNEVFAEQTVIPALGHDKVTHAGQNPTCTEDGWYNYVTCTRCNYTNYVKKPATGHKEKTDSAVAPTCTETGLTAGKSCSTCGTVLVKQETVAALGHISVNDSAVSPTCTAPGLTAGKHCSRCSAVLTAQTTVSALGHAYKVPTSPNYNGICVSKCTRCNIMESVSVITYSAYGAVGDGVTDDSEAIRRAHNAANYLGLPVEGSSGDTYYIGAITQTITIKTSTDWKGATFIFDDSKIMWNNSTLRSVNVFTITHDDQYLYYDVTVPTALKNNGLSKGATKIEGLNLSGPAMILIENSNQRIFKRYGVNADSGDAMQEMLYVDKDGNIIGTPVQYDYTTITKIRVYSVTDETISVGNAKVITIVPNPKAQDPSYENNYCFFNRGIIVRRSNTILHDIEHIIEGEDMSVIIDRDGDGYTGDDDPDGDGLPEKWTDDKSYGVPYNGFFGFEYAYNVQFKDCKVQGHQAYNFYQTGGRNEMGSYDIYAKYCVGLQLRGITQRENYGAYASDTVITNRFMYHGVMGSYYCRNIVMDNCRVDRFDSHKGMHNATITNSKIGFGILVIGGGDLYIENVYRIGNRDSEDDFVLLRHDYNSVFDGNLIIKNCRMGPNVKNIVNGVWRSFDCGLPNYMFRSVTIDGLTVETSGGDVTYNIYIFKVSGAAKTATSDATNPLYLPTSVTVKNVSKTKVSGTGYLWLSVNTSKNGSDAFSTISVSK